MFLIIHLCFLILETPHMDLCIDFVVASKKFFLSAFSIEEDAFASKALRDFE